MAVHFELTHAQAHDAAPCKMHLKRLQPGRQDLGDKANNADWIREITYEQETIDEITPKFNRENPPNLMLKPAEYTTKQSGFWGDSKPRSSAS